MTTTTRERAYTAPTRNPSSYYRAELLAERIRAIADKVATFDPNDRVPRPLIDPLSAVERWADKHGNDEHNRSCLDRIEDHAASNEETFGPLMWFHAAWSRSDHSDRFEDAERRIEEGPLSVTRNGNKLKLTIEESTGGPADGYRVEFDPHTGDVEGVEYYFQDWFDGATLEIDQRDFPATWAYVGYWANAAAAGTIHDEGDDE